jgi:hypothetical protein
MALKEFFKNALSAVNPKSYDDFVRNSYKEVFRHFFLLLFFAMLLFLALNIPKLATFQPDFQRELAKFDIFTINVNATTKEPANLLLFSIDTKNNTEPGSEGLMFTKDYLMIKYLPYLPATKENLSQYKNVVSSSAVYQTKIFILVLLLLPSIAIALYLYYSAKFLLIITLATIIGFIIARIAKHDITFSAVFKTAVYASIFLVLELVLRVFISNMWIQQLAPLAIFILFFTIGVAGAKHKKTGYREIKGKDVFAEQE